MGMSMGIGIGSGSGSCCSALVINQYDDDVDEDMVTRLDLPVPFLPAVDHLAIRDAPTPAIDDGLVGELDPVTMSITTKTAATPATNGTEAVRQTIVQVQTAMYLGVVVDVDDDDDFDDPIPPAPEFDDSLWGTNGSGSRSDQPEDCPTRDMGSTSTTSFASSAEWFTSERSLAVGNDNDMDSDSDSENDDKDIQGSSLFNTDPSRVPSSSNGPTRLVYRTPPTPYKAFIPSARHFLLQPSPHSRSRLSVGSPTFARDDDPLGQGEKRRARAPSLTLVRITPAKPASLRRSRPRPDRGIGRLGPAQRIDANGRVISSRPLARYHGDNDDPGDDDDDEQVPSARRDWAYQTPRDQDMDRLPIDDNTPADSIPTPALDSAGRMAIVIDDSDTEGPASPGKGRTGAESTLSTPGAAVPRFSARPAAQDHEDDGVGPTQIMGPEWERDGDGSGILEPVTTRLLSSTPTIHIARAPAPAPAPALVDMDMDGDRIVSDRASLEPGRVRFWLGPPRCRGGWEGCDAFFDQLEQAKRGGKAHEISRRRKRLLSVNAGQYVGMNRRIRTLISMYDSPNASRDDLARAWAATIRAACMAESIRADKRVQGEAGNPWRYQGGKTVILPHELIAAILAHHPSGATSVPWDTLQQGVNTEWIRLSAIEGGLKLGATTTTSARGGAAGFARRRTSCHDPSWTWMDELRTRSDEAERCEAAVIKESREPRKSVCWDW